MSSTASQSTATNQSGLTGIELGNLVAWADLHGLELVTKAAGGDFCGVVAEVGYGEGIAAWVVHRTTGKLWLDFIADPAAEGWTESVATLGDAMERMITATEE